MVLIEGQSTQRTIIRINLSACLSSRLVSHTWRGGGPSYWHFADHRANYSIWSTLSSPLDTKNSVKKSLQVHAGDHRLFGILWSSEKGAKMFKRWNEWLSKSEFSETRCSSCNPFIRERSRSENYTRDRKEHWKLACFVGKGLICFRTMWGQESKLLSVRMSFVKLRVHATAVETNRKEP